LNEPENEPVLIWVDDETVPVGRICTICVLLLTIPVGNCVELEKTPLVARIEPVIPCVTFTDPLNTAGPIFVNVEEPDTVSEPVIVWSPTKLFEPVVAKIL
jgi:hypothetical protein